MPVDASPAMPQLFANLTVGGLSAQVTAMMVLAGNVYLHILERAVYWLKPSSW